MFNVTILKLRDLVKFIVIVILAVVAVTLLSRIKFKKAHTETLGMAIPTVFKAEDEQKQEIKMASVSDGVKNIINSQVAAISQIQNPEISAKETKKEEDSTGTEGESNNGTNGEESAGANSEVDIASIASAGVQTEVTTQNPLQDKYTAQFGSVKIKNETDYNLTNEMLTPDITIENKNILIFHTHTCESYTSSDAYPYTPTGNFRTTDLNFTVSRVGAELEKYLKAMNYNVYHDITYHDYPAYNGSYTRSLESVTKDLQQTPSDIVIDLHRDAVGSRSDYAPTVKIGDETAAQIMFVIGTDNGGLEHPNWNQNLKFAIKIQQKAEEMYPGLFKPITLTKSRYNQHASKYANIMEVGATGNTLEQCLTSMKYLSKVIDEALK